MKIKTVLVFGASGAQGIAQFRELTKDGYIPKAASRRPSPFSDSEFSSIEVRRADYDESSSLASALQGIDAVFYQAPAMGDIGRLVRHSTNLVNAIKASHVKLTIVNSSMWSPDEWCGDPHYDGVRLMEQSFEKGGFPLIILRPTLFMNNLLGDWIKPILVNEGAFRYNHNEKMAANWLSLEDMAKFMVACLKRSDLIGRRLQVGGPQRPTTAEVIKILSEVIGRPIKHEYLTPDEFAEHYWSLHGEESGLPHDVFVSYFARFHAFNNDAPQRPFQCDPKAVQALFPFPLMDLKTWALQQKWKE